jgi:hypothetical protein
MTIKSKELNSVGHIVRIWQMRNINTFLSDSPKATDHLGKITFDGRVVLRWILRK